MDENNSRLNSSTEDDNVYFNEKVHSQVSGGFESKDEILETIYSFSNDIVANFSDFVRSVVVFGSVVKKNDPHKINDIDILIVIDDTSVSVDVDFIRNYQTKLSSVANKYKNLHITSTRLKRFWKLAINSDPVILSIIREGFIVFDTKFVEMFKHLLFDGFIKPSPESVFVQINRARMGLDKIRNKKISLLIDVYWALVDSVQALIMYYGRLPPPPERLSVTLVEIADSENKFLLSPKEIRFIDEVYDLAKRVMHRQRKKVEFYELNELYDKSYEIVEKIDKHILG